MCEAVRVKRKAGGRRNAERRATPYPRGTQPYSCVSVPVRITACASPAMRAHSAHGACTAPVDNFCKALCALLHSRLAHPFAVGWHTLLHSAGIYPCTRLAPPSYSAGTHPCTRSARTLAQCLCIPFAQWLIRTFAVGLYYSGAMPPAMAGNGRANRVPFPPRYCVCFPKYAIFRSRTARSAKHETEAALWQNYRERLPRSLPR